MKKLNLNCYTYDTNMKDTMGNPILGRKCYCGTTACMQQEKLQLKIFDKNENDEIDEDSLHKLLYPRPKL